MIVKVGVFSMRMLVLNKTLTIHPVEDIKKTYIFLKNSSVIVKGDLENSRKLRDVSVRCRSYFALRKVGLTYSLTYLLTNSGDDITVTSLQVN